MFCFLHFSISQKTVLLYTKCLKFASVMSSLVSLTLKDHTNLCSVLAHLLVLGDSILESITLLLHSKNAKNIILMQCSNALSLCVLMTLSFSARPFKALLNMSPRSLSGGESFLFVRSKKSVNVWTTSLLGIIISGSRVLYRWIFTKVRKQMASTQFCHTAAIFFLRTANYHQKWHFCGSAI